MKKRKVIVMLTPDKVRYENGVKICEKLIPDDAVATKNVASYVPKGSKMKPCVYMKPIGITMHNTGDLKNVYDDAEQYTRATWPNCNMNGVVVHYYVDDVGAWQNLREDETGWHAADGTGNGNRKTIAIECIMSGTTGTENLKARDNAARLAASILVRHNLTINDLYTHNHWLKKPDKIVNDKKKNCPIYLLPDWDGFKALVQNYIDDLKPPVKTDENTTVTNPNTGAASSTLRYEDIKKGDILLFTGSKQYITSVYKIARNAKAGRVKVTNITKKTAAHPIHVRAINSEGEFVSGVYGWVDLADLSYNTPYKISTKGKSINVMKGPGSSYALVKTVSKGVYTIVEEQNGWGKLKSGMGWIDLSLVEKM